MLEEFCQNCKTKLHPRVASYSLAQFKKYLCILCQKEERLRKYPPKLAEFLNKQI